ncbi:MAG: transcription-repair coupling factor, partial [Verrucomicrobia bacterium]|nr:transcription-repair coupling factor [Verrucomicrobiota bacterium]
MPGNTRCHRVHPSALPVLAAALRIAKPQSPILVVLDGVKAQELCHQDLQTWLAEDLGAAGKPSSGKFLASNTVCPLLFYPAWDILPHESKLPHADVLSERLETLLALTNLKTSDWAPVITTHVTALMQRTFSPEDIRSRSRILRKGDHVDPLDLVEWLEEQGYEPEAQINHKGELALRGGILDIFPLTSPWPVRLEFFGDDLDSLRWFDPNTQLSKDATEQIVLSPAGELGILKRLLSKDSSSAPSLGSLLDHVPKGTILLTADTAAVEIQANAYFSQVPVNDPFLLSWTDFREQAASREAHTLSIEEPSAEESPAESAEFELQSLEAFRPLGTRMADTATAEAQRIEFFGQIHRWLRQGYRVQVVCNNEGERQRFGEIWKEMAFKGDSDPPEAVLGVLGRGFLCQQAKAVVVSDAEVFGRFKVQRPRRMKSPHAAAVRSALDIDFTELTEGDYVVHLQHGIGRFLGLKTLEPTPEKGKGRTALGDSAGEECLVIEYAPRDPEEPAPKLYVPVSESHLVGKYVGTGKARPPLNTLGGTRWMKAREQAEEAVRDLAAELLSIQASRETEAGHPFPPDNTWQREFEGSFLYEETPDQMKAILDAKRDMERPKPMDRLICGDVGYGKTEVAIRAAFKTVMGGKQAAILVPTTVLAQQHYNTFRERMADYPIRVEILSRFRKPRQIRQVIELLATGAVDIVIGTHRLLQKDIVFKDLGLVVIDEEQRFGVMHKERFKLLRKLVDVLTLSATPIPRTLHLALTGARDMSTIETPPQDRLPVETVVCQYDERVIRDAIQRELNRQGQVFFLHNRVMDIEEVARKLKALVPHARFAVGHGQMDPAELEEVMTRFVNGEADVLLSTTIIESGIDISNANTIIIDRADRFGLSDLYQLRGRVGRYKHQAFAYLMIPRHAGLLSDARKRISAIKQYSSLGSGFKIAMRDLEIRGAGNLLGPEQSGHITAVGFELYCQLLKQSVRALKGLPQAPRTDVTLRLDFLARSPAEEAVLRHNDTEASETYRKRPKWDISVPRETAVWMLEDSDGSEPVEQEEAPVVREPAYIPLQYIQDSKQRVEIYRKLAQCTDLPATKTL